MDDSLADERILKDLERASGVASVPARDNRDIRRKELANGLTPGGTPCGRHGELVFTHKQWKGDILVVAFCPGCGRTWQYRVESREVVLPPPPDGPWEPLYSATASQSKYWGIQV